MKDFLERAKTIGSTILIILGAIYFFGHFVVIWEEAKHANCPNGDSVVVDFLAVIPLQPAYTCQQGN